MFISHIHNLNAIKIAKYLCIKLLFWNLKKNVFDVFIINDISFEVFKTIKNALSLSEKYQHHKIETVNGVDLSNSYMYKNNVFFF